MYVEKGFNSLPQAFVLTEVMNIFGRFFSLMCWIESICHAGNNRLTLWEASLALTHTSCSLVIMHEVMELVLGKGLASMTAVMRLFLWIDILKCILGGFNPDAPASWPQLQQWPGMQITCSVFGWYWSIIIVFNILHKHRPCWIPLLHPDWRLAQVSQHAQGCTTRYCAVLSRQHQLLTLCCVAAQPGAQAAPLVPGDCGRHASRSLVAWWMDPC